VSRDYELKWEGDWPGLTVKVPEGSELAVAEIGYDTARHPQGYIGARTLNVKLVFIDLDDPPHPVMEPAALRPLTSVKGQDE